MANVFVQAGRLSAPRITSLLKNITHTLRQSQQGRHKIATNVVNDADSKMFYWLVDDTYFGGSASKNEH